MSIAKDTSSTNQPSDDQLSNSRGDVDMTWVLVVDDNESERSELAEIVSDMGHFTWLASSLAEAQWRVRDDADIRAVILDIGLPDGNGLKLLESLNQGKSHLTSDQIVVVTGLDEAELQEKTGLEQVNHIFHKPVDILALEETVNAILRK